MTPAQAERLTAAIKRHDIDFLDGPITDAYARFLKAVVELRKELPDG